MNRSFALLMGLSALVAPGARAQTPGGDVELLGQVHGTRPPAAYYDLRRRDPGAFGLERGMAAGRGLPASGLRAGAGLRAEQPAGAASIVLGQGRVQGTFRFPVVLGLFADSPEAPFTRAVIQGHFFDGPNPTGTITELYREMSGGLVELRGEVTQWQRASLPRDSVTRGTSGLGGSARVGEFIMELLAQLPPIDWGRYDNDGPDGVPNSGDDDGYVDVLAVLHPTTGAECGGEDRAHRVWSHKWTLDATVGQEFVTASRTPSGAHIRVDDYTIQPVYDCAGKALNEIGVFAHELGHGFGLPDLYGESWAGVGRWDLMGSGSWGCSTLHDPARPCPMGAWSKAMLGWLSVDRLPFGGDWRSVTLDPVETGRRAVAIPSGDGSGEYWLLENRQRIGFDAAIPETGLLVWHIDPWWIEAQLQYNGVNDTPSRMGVRLMQADGLDQLALNTTGGGNRGDAGDPFTGEEGKSAFHAGTLPKAFTHAKSAGELITRGIPAGSAAGVTVVDIARSGQRVSFRALARYQTLRVRTAGDGEAVGLVKVDGAAAGDAVRSAPFQRHTLEAAAGAPLGDGIRRGFQGWEDAPGEPRVRAWTTGLADAELVARYGGPRELRFRGTLAGGTQVSPGTIVTVPASPDLWFDEGTPVSFRAEPRTGFAFRTWSGALTGAANPQLLLMDQPKDATATFEMVFGLDPAARVELVATVDRETTLQALHANEPVTWIRRSGVLPEGISFHRDGVLSGEPVETGDFPLELTVRDAIGLEASGTVTVRVAAPVIGTSELAARFLLAGDPLSEVQQRFLDLAGNRNGAYDLGDFRAYVRAHPDAPAATPPAAPAPHAVPLVDFAPGTPR